MHDLLLVELFDVEFYYRDLGMWVRGYSRSLKMVPFESLGAVFYSSSTITMALSIVSFARYSDLLVENGEFFLYLTCI